MQRAVVVKAYKVPVKAPLDLIEAYFEVKKKALSGVLKHVKYSSSRKAHLHFNKDERRKLRSKLLEKWKYSKHYVDSAINSVIGLVKGWVKLYNRGKAKSKPEITKKNVYIKTTLFTCKNEVLKVSIEPRRRYLVVDLKEFEWLPRDYTSIGGLILKEGELIITFKRKLN